MSPEGGFRELIDQSLRVLAKFDAARSGRVPYSAQGRCPVCRKGMVQYRYRGPRAVRMSCETPDCIAVMG